MSKLRRQYRYSPATNPFWLGHQINGQFVLPLDNLLSMIHTAVSKLAQGQSVLELHHVSVESWVIAKRDQSVDLELELDTSENRCCIYHKQNSDHLELVLQCQFQLSQENLSDDMQIPLTDIQQKDFFKADSMHHFGECYHVIQQFAADETHFIASLSEDASLTVQLAAALYSLTYLHDPQFHYQPNPKLPQYLERLRFNLSTIDEPIVLKASSNSALLADSKGQVALHIEGLAFRVKSKPALDTNLEPSAAVNLKSDYFLYATEDEVLAINNVSTAKVLVVDDFKESVVEGQQSCTYTEAFSQDGEIILYDLSYFKSFMNLPSILTHVLELCKNTAYQPVQLVIALGPKQQHCAYALAAFFNCLKEENPKIHAVVSVSDTCHLAHATAAITTKCTRVTWDKDLCYAQAFRKLPGITAKIASAIKPQGRYVLIGGTGGLGSLLTNYLTSTYRAEVVIIGRSQPQQQAKTTKVSYYQLDVTDKQAVNAFFAEHTASYDGVFYLAGVREDSLVIHANKEALLSSVASKLEGLMHVHQALQERNLGFFCLFSSLSAELGAVGQAVYAAANATLNSYALEQEQLRLEGQHPCRFISISWPFWQEGGMRIDQQYSAHLKHYYQVKPLESAQGFALLEQALLMDTAHIVIANDALLASKIKLPEQAAEEPLSDTDIAIIGLAFELPDAANLASLWDNLLAGKNSIKEVSRKWPYLPYKWGAYLDSIAAFDPGFFNIAPSEAALMDPQERLFLANAWHCLQDAGYSQESDQQIGVIAAVMFNMYQNYGVEQKLLQGDDALPQALNASIANRVSYALNLTGPSFALDSMCSSAVTAIDMACRYINDGEVDAMLVGGVNLSSHPYHLAALAQSQVLSKTGISAPFGQDADGYIPGEGVVVLLLKQAQKAMADNDTIYGVIKAVAVNHSGTGPSFNTHKASAQASVIREALTKASVLPEKVQYLEAHGHATLAGDPVELDGIKYVFGNRSVDNPLYVGCIKSNIGHLESAAPLAGILKVLAQFQHHKLAPTIHADSLNPDLDVVGTGIEILTSPRQLSKLHYAGISSFGAGGSNGHLLLQNLTNNLIQRPKTQYQLQDYWLNPIENVHFFSLNICPSVQKARAHCDLIYQLNTGTETRYFKSISDEMKVEQALVLVLQPRLKVTQMLNHLKNCVALHAQVQFLFVHQHRSSWQEMHALILSVPALATHYGKNILLPHILSLDASEVAALVVREAQEAENRLIIYSAQGQRHILEAQVFKPNNQVQQELSKARIAVLDGFGDIGRSFCQALIHAGIKQFEVFGSSDISEAYQHLLEQWGPGVVYRKHDFSQAYEGEHYYDVVINCMSIVPQQAAEMQTMHQHLIQFIQSNQLDKLITISSLAALTGFSHDKEFAVFSAALIDMAAHGKQHVLAYLPPVQLHDDQAWLYGNKDRQGLESILWEDLLVICSHLLTVPAGEYLPFKGDAQRFQQFLKKECFSVPSVSATDSLSNSEAGYYPSSALRQDIVICGYFCSFAQCPNPEQFWHALQAGKDCSQIPVSERFDAASNGLMKMGLLADFDCFDFDFFELSLEQAKYMDPQQRKLLELSWHVFEQAGVSPHSLRGQSIGVFVAIQGDDYARLLDRNQLSHLNQFTGCASNLAANRISYFYDFHGPSETIDTGSSSSFAALNRAVLALRNGECESALVLGVSLICDPKSLELGQQLQVLSLENSCRPFDAKADGYVKGEGLAGIWIMGEVQALEQSLRARASIQSVHLNHGGRSQSLTVPNPIVLKQLLVDVYSKDGLAIGDIDYLEAHAIASPAGDSLEFTALQEVFASRTKPLYLGSVKSTIGYTEPVAGLAGIIKALLMLEQQQIPKQANFHTAHAQINLAASCFKIAHNTQTETLNRIAINCFGFGGSNGHCVIAKTISQPSNSLECPWYLVKLSAQTIQVIDKMQLQLLEWLSLAKTPVNLSQLSYTLNIGRADFDCRRVYLVQNIDDLQQQLAQTYAKPMDFEGSSLIQQRLVDLYQSAPQLHDYLTLLAQAYVHGQSIDWNYFYDEIKLEPLSLPVYPFAATRCWFEDRAQDADQQNAQQIDCYQEIWRKKPMDKLNLADYQFALILLHSSQRAWVTKLCNSIGSNLKMQLVCVDDTEKLTAALEILTKSKRPLIYYFAGMYQAPLNADSITKSQQWGLGSFIEVIKSLQKIPKLRLYVYSNNAYGMQAQAKHPFAASLHGLAQSLKKEYPQWEIECIDIADNHLSPNVFTLNSQGQAYPLVLNKEGVWQRQLQAVEMGIISTHMRNAVLVFIGGQGKVGKSLIGEFVKHAPKAIIIASRSATLKTEGCIHWVPLDCTDEDATDQFIKEIIRQYGQIDYLYLLAVHYHEQALVSLSFAEYMTQMRSKVLGTYNVIKACFEREVKQVVINSPVQVYSQTKHRGAYTAACFYADALVGCMQHSQVKLVHWGFWAQDCEEANALLVNAGISPISAKQGYLALNYVAASVASNLSFFNVSDSVKTMMPIIFNQESGDLDDLVLFNRGLQELEHYCFHLIKFKLVTQGLIWSEAKPTFAESLHYCVEYFEALVSQLKYFERTHYPKSSKNQIKTWEELLNMRLDLSKRFPEIVPFFNILAVCAENLMVLFRGEKTIQDVIFPYGQDVLVRAVYQNNILASQFNQAIATKVGSILVNANKPLHILELGAGVGATTEAILNRCAQEVYYTFSDINPQFVKQAQVRFQQFNHFKAIVLDINDPQSNQTYDLIIASNVLHSANDIRQCLLGLSSLLNVGGKLIINEATANSLFLASTFGLFKQWQVNKEAFRIVSNPLMNLTTWHYVLEELGFEVSVYPMPDEVDQSIIVAELTSKVSRSLWQFQALAEEEAVNHD